MTDVSALSIIASIIGLFIAAVLTFMSTRLSKLLDNQITQGTDIAVAKALLATVSTRVDSIHEWRNKLMEQEAAKAARTIEDLTAQLAHFKAN